MYGLWLIAPVVPPTGLPSVLRVQPMINSWHDAFNIQPADKMFIPKEKRAMVW